MLYVSCWIIDTCLMETIQTNKTQTTNRAYLQSANLKMFTLRGRGEEDRLVLDNHTLEPSVFILCNTCPIPPALGGHSHGILLLRTPFLLVGWVVAEESLLFVCV